MTTITVSLLCSSFAVFAFWLLFSARMTDRNRHRTYRHRLRKNRYMVEIAACLFFVGVASLIIGLV